MVRAVFRPEAELMIFLCMRTEEIAKIVAHLWAIAVAEHDGIYTR